MARPGFGSASRRLLWLLAWCGGILALLAVYLRMSRVWPVNSDGAGNALEAWDMLHGNLLLHGWHLTDVSFYTTELPEYMLVEVARGLGPDVVHVAAAVTYTLLVAFAALLARGEATGRLAAARMALAAGVLLAPQPGSGVLTLLESPDHTGTAVPVMAAWLIIDRAGRKLWVPVAVAALLAWAIIADALVIYLGIVPLILVGGIRAYREIVVRRRAPGTAWFEIALAAAGALALVAGLAGEALIRAGSGYHVSQPGGAFAAGDLATQSVARTALGILTLYGANMSGLGLGFTTGLVLLHLAGVALAAWGVCRGLRRFFSELDVVGQLLVTGVVILLGIYAVSRMAYHNSYRDIAALLPFGAVLAARLLTGRLLAARLGPVLLAVLVGYGISLTSAAVRPLPASGRSYPSVSVASARVADWLAGLDLRYGLADYWAANSTTLESHDRVRVRSVSVNGHALLPMEWESKASWYNPRLNDASFVLLGPTGTRSFPALGSARRIEAILGHPARVYRLGRFRVLVYQENLLADLSPRGSTR